MEKNSWKARPRSSNFKPKNRPVINTSNNIRYETLKEAAKALNIGESTLYKAFRNKKEYTRGKISLKII